MALGLNVAGRSIRVGSAGNWIATLPENERESYFEANPELEEIWDDKWGDRGTQLVLIGTDMDHDTLRTDLDTALLTDEEMDADWTAFDDRFPTWDDEDAAKPGETTGELTETADDGAEEVGLAD